MTIEGIGSIDPLRKEATIRESNVVPTPQESDAINFSKEARAKNEFQIAKAQVQNADDVRADRIAYAREKIHDPAYFNDPRVIDAIAGRISDLFLG